MWDGSDRQTDRQANRISRGRRTHNMSVSLKSNTGSTFPEASLPGRWAPISLPFSPPGRWTETWRTGSLWLGPIPPREAPSLPAPRLPTATDAGQPPPARGGKPRPPQPPPPALLPSLPLSRPPSLSPSLARCRSRALPRATCSGPNPGISEREKKEKTSLCAKERKKEPLTAFILHALRLGWPRFPRPGHGPAPAEVCGACCLAHEDRRAPRTASCTPWTTAAATRTPLRPQGPSYRLNIRLPGSPRASAPGASSAPSAAQVLAHTRSTLVCALTPARHPSPARPPPGALGLPPGPGLQTSSRAPDPHKARRPDAPIGSPRRRRRPSPVSEKSCLSASTQAWGPSGGCWGARVPGKPPRNRDRRG